MQAAERSFVVSRRRERVEPAAVDQRTEIVVNVCLTKENAQLKQALVNAEAAKVELERCREEDSQRYNDKIQQLKTSMARDLDENCKYYEKCNGQLRNYLRMEEEKSRVLVESLEKIQANQAQLEESLIAERGRAVQSENQSGVSYVDIDARISKEYYYLGFVDTTFAANSTLERLDVILQCSHQVSDDLKVVESRLGNAEGVNEQWVNYAGGLKARIEASELSKSWGDEIVVAQQDEIEELKTLWAESINAGNELRVQLREAVVSSKTKIELKR
jgi:hypothetical protein